MGLRERVAEFMGWHYCLIVYGENDPHKYLWVAPDLRGGWVASKDLPPWNECRNWAQEVLERAEEMGLFIRVIDHLREALRKDYSKREGVAYLHTLEWAILTASPRAICVAVLEAYDVT